MTTTATTAAATFRRNDIVRGVKYGLFQVVSVKTDVRGIGDILTVVQINEATGEVDKYRMRLTADCFDASSIRRDA